MGVYRRVLPALYRFSYVALVELSGRRVALVMMSAIGDVIHALPLVNSIRVAAPTVHLTWVLQPAPLQLLAPHPAVDEFLIFHRARGWRAFLEVRRAARTRSFDVVLAPHVYFKAGIVTGLLRSPRKIGFDRHRAPDLNWLFTTERLPPRPRAHAQDEMLEFVDYLGLRRNVEWRLGPYPGEVERYWALLPPSDRPTVALVLASSRQSKNWAADRYLELAQRLTHDLGLRLVLVGGRSEAEERVAATLSAGLANAPLDLREWDLRRLVYLLDRADVLVTPDSGPMHIGVALGTPTVALMGYTNPKRVGPYRFRDLVVDAFGDRDEDYSPLAPNRPGRMERISPEMVVARVQQALMRYGRRAGSSPGGPL